MGVDASLVTAAADEPLTVLRGRAALRLQWLFPVIDAQSALLGVIPRGDLVELDGRALRPRAKPPYQPGS